MPAPFDPAVRPPGRAAGHQKWRHLLFLHWRVEPEVVAAKLPAGLEVDTFDGSAWVGLVPFLMTGVRPWWFTPVPGVSTFPETNVRTYVRCPTPDGRREPGVYFFSLEAGRSLPVHVARRRWHLPYHRAAMSLTREQAGDRDRVRYRSRRLWPGTPGVGGEIEVTVHGPPAPAEPGSLEHFLCERYLLFCGGPRPSRTAGLLRGRVFHPPYPLRGVTVDRCTDTLVADAGFGVPPACDHATFSDGVDVAVFPLRGVGGSDAGARRGAA